MTHPGSAGEHQAQAMYGTSRRASVFYNKQMLDHLNPAMRDFIAEREFVMIATADSQGEGDCSFRAGPPGFVQSLDERTLIYPEYRGNGVMASVGNMLENPGIGLLFVDFVRHSVGLHANGAVEIMEPGELVSRLGPHSRVRLDFEPGRQAERWVLVTVAEAYIHCSKHIPRFAAAEKTMYWGTDDDQRKGGDFFGAKAGERPWAADPVQREALTR